MARRPFARPAKKKQHSDICADTPWQTRRWQFCDRHWISALWLVYTAWMWAVVIPRSFYTADVQLDMRVNAVLKRDGIV